jgi:hypothetical protein
MRGSDDPNIHPDRFFSAEPLKLLILQHLQKLRLQFEIHVANLIKEYGSLIAQFKHAQLLLESAGECPALIPKQLAFDQFGGQRGTVHFQELLLSARRVSMKLPGQYFLTHAGFAKDQRRSIGPPDLGEQGLNLLHQWIVSEEYVLSDWGCGGGRRYGGGGRSRFQHRAKHPAQIRMVNRLT